MSEYIPPKWYVIPHKKFGDVTILHSLNLEADWNIFVFQATQGRNASVYDAYSPKYGEIQFLWYWRPDNEFIAALTERGLCLKEKDRAELLRMFRETVPQQVAQPKQLEMVL